MLLLWTRRTQCKCDCWFKELYFFLSCCRKFSWWGKKKDKSLLYFSFEVVLWWVLFIIQWGKLLSIMIWWWTSLSRSKLCLITEKQVALAKQTFVPRFLQLHYPPMPLQKNRETRKKRGKFLLLKSETIYWRFDTYTTYNQTPTRNKH